MNPAPSIIFFTTISGMGYGMLAWLGLFGPLQLLSDRAGFVAPAMFVALLFIAAGLISSTFHLGHPERAWRALTQWRSSWLSREGVAAVVTFVPALIFAFGWLFIGEASEVWGLFGLLASVGAVATVYCTAMIYRSLRAIPNWHRGMVVANYLLLAAASGGVWLNAMLLLNRIERPFFTAVVLALVLLAWISKILYWRDTAEPAGVSTAGSATGLGRLGRVALLETPNWEVNYLQKEMVFQVARKHADKLRLIAHFAGFVAPAVACAVIWMDVAWMNPILAILAASSITLGVVTERWLFFAEARHAVGLYYGVDRI